MRKLDRHGNARFAYERERISLVENLPGETQNEQLKIAKVKRDTIKHRYHGETCIPLPRSNWNI